MPLTAAFFSVILIWSTTPLAIKWSTLGAGSSFALMARMLIGAVICIMLLAVLRIRFPMHARARLAYLVSGISLFGAMSLTYWSAQFVTSGMISVLFGMSPLLTSLGAAMWLKEDALRANKLAGMLLGLFGLVLVFSDSFQMGRAASVGLLSLFAGVLVQSMGLVWLKRIGDDSPPLATTLGSLVVGMPLFFTVWWLFDGHWPQGLPVRALAAIVYLAVIGSVIGFVLYYYLIKHMEAGRIALITLITPVLALLLGHGMNDETVLPQVWAGTAAIMLGLAVHRWGGYWLAKLPIRR